MASNNVHIIAKHFLHLTFPNQEDINDRQMHIRTVYYEKLVRRMGELFDKYIGPEEIISLKTLKIDLGQIAWNNFEEEFISRALEQLELKLIELTRLDQSQIRPVSFRQNRFQQWLYFLENGVTAWQVSIRDEADFHRAVLDTLGMHSGAIEQLRSLIHSNPKAFDRLILQHDNTFLKTLTELYTSKKQETLLNILTESKSLLNKLDRGQKERNPQTQWKDSPSNWRFAFWYNVLHTVIIDREKADWQQLAVEF